MIYIRNLLFAFFLLYGIMVFPQKDYETIQAKSSYSGSWISYQTKLVELLPDYNPVSDGRDDFTRYGTYKYLKTEATGFFYVKKIDGRWWMVDPEGYAGINMAVTSFTTSSIQDNYDIIKKNGFNGTGNFLSSESQTKTGYNLQNHVTFSFTRRINFYQNYKNNRKNYYETPSGVQGSTDHILVLDPMFAEYCDELASKSVTPFAEERDLLGYFTDNELNFNQDQLRNLIKDLHEDDPSRKAALEFAYSKGLTEEDCIQYTSNVTEAIKQEFATLLAEHYFKTVAEAIRKYDPNHLILGSRLHGRPRDIEGVVRASHKYMDVTSVNFYDKFNPDSQISKETWTDDHPCIIGEFYIKDINTFNKTQSGAGWYVNNQSHRGYFYQNTCLELLKNKCYTGWHYFRFEDDTDSNKGIVNSTGKEYTDMTKYMKELNEQVYRICDYYDGIQRRPESGKTSYTFTATEDTWVIPGAANNENNGKATELEVNYHSVEANRREAFFKFDISSVKALLPELKHAEIEVYCTSTDGNTRSLFLSGIEDTSWEEEKLTGTLRHTNSDWKNGYNRLDYYKSSFRTGKLTFNVTTWLAEQVEDETVSFKLHELVANTVPLKFASKEHENTEYHPRLILTFWDENASSVQDIAKGNDKYNAFIYPGSKILRIDCDIPFHSELYMISGQKIYTTDKPESNLSFLPSGIYILKVSTTENEVFSKKLLLF